MEMFDNQILVFRVSTVLFIIAVIIAFFLIMRRNRIPQGVFMSLFLTIFVFLAMELQWETATWLRWAYLKIV
jgi:hypothetical protein